MTPGKSYIFASDLIPYFRKKGIIIEEASVGHGCEYRLVIKVKDDTMVDGQKTIHVFSNNYLTNSNLVGFTRQYLEYHFKKIKKIPEYLNIEI